MNSTNHHEWIETMRAGDIQDPRLFQSLVQTLMLAERGARYQVVDDAGGDGGLDGFDRERGELHAIYCPEKPEKAELEPRRYVKKFRKDLAKAVQLRDAGGYGIRIFAFVTPARLREPLQRQIRDEAKAAGFEDGICISGDALDVMLARHPEVVELFPQLVLPRLESQVATIREGVEQLVKRQDATSAGSEEKTDSTIPDDVNRPYDRSLLNDVDEPELDEVEEALRRGDRSAVHRLALVRAETTNPAVLVATLLIEQEHWFNHHDYTRAALVCEHGIRIARGADMKAEEATLHALLARLLAIEASEVDLRRTADLKAAELTGVVLCPPSEMTASLARVRALSTRIEGEVSAALRLVHGGGAHNLEATYWTYAMVGAVEAYMLTPRLLLSRLGYGGEDEVSAARRRIQSAHEAAIRVSVHNGPDAQVRAYGNAANDLRLAGELEVALVFARRAVEVARREGVLAPQAEILLRALTHEVTEGSSWSA